MAKFKMYLDLGRERKEEIIEIDDSELENLSEEERDNLILEYWRGWSENYIEGGWEEVK